MLRDRSPVAARSPRLTPLDMLPRALRLPFAIALGAAPFAMLDSLLGSFGHVAPILLPLLAPIFGPLLTPLCAELDVYRYHSRFLLSMAGWRKRVLHLGTGFDRIVHRRELDGSNAGNGARTALLTSVIEGLISIAEDVEEGRTPPHQSFAATSHFFNEPRARSLGFAARTAPMGDALAFYAIGWFDALLLSNESRRTTYVDHGTPESRILRSSVGDGVWMG